MKTRSWLAGVGIFYFLLGSYAPMAAWYAAGPPPNVVTAAVIHGMCTLLAAVGVMMVVENAYPRR